MKKDKLQELIDAGKVPSLDIMTSRSARIDGINISWTEDFDGCLVIEDEALCWDEADLLAVLGLYLRWKKEHDI